MVRDASEEVEEPQQEQEKINWKARIRKWRSGINLDSATNSDLLDYIQTMSYDYLSDNTLRDRDLWLEFYYNFKDWTVAVFGRVARKELQRLQACLRYGGVFVAINTKHKSIAQALVDVLDKEEYHGWVLEDFSETDKELLYTYMPWLALKLAPA